MSQRSERVADLIRTELSAIIQRDVRDPRVALASVSHIRLSGDLSHAVVGISVLGNDEDAREETVTVLKRAMGFIRGRLARKVHLRVVPQLIFKLDRGAEHSQNISDLLETLTDVEPT